MALRLRPMNGSHNTKWAHMRRSNHVIQYLGFLSPMFVSSTKGIRGSQLDTYAACICMSHLPMNKGISSIPNAPHIFFCLPRSRVDLQGLGRLNTVLRLFLLVLSFFSFLFFLWVDTVIWSSNFDLKLCFI